MSTIKRMSSAGSGLFVLFICQVRRRRDETACRRVANTRRVH